MASLTLAPGSTFCVDVRQRSVCASAMSHSPWSRRGGCLQGTCVHGICLQVQEGGGSEVRERVHISPHEQLELAGSKGTANFVMKFDKVRLDVTHQLTRRPFNTLSRGYKAYRHERCWRTSAGLPHHMWFCREARRSHM